MKTAILDIGSNSVRMLWGSCCGLGEKHIVTTQLGEGLDASGILSDAAVARTMDAVNALSARARADGAERFAAFATEAVRAAANGKAFCDRVAKETGVNVEVLDGATEARCGFIGATRGIKGSVGVLDIGGASVELVVGDGEITYAKSLPIGVVRLKERYRENFAALDRELDGLADYGGVPEFETLVGIGGTPTTLAAMARNMNEYDASRVHLSVVTCEDARRYAEYASGVTTNALMGRYPSLVRRRAEVIPYGLKLIACMMKKCGKDTLTVSERDNLEGYGYLRGLLDAD